LAFVWSAATVPSPARLLSREEPTGHCALSHDEDPYHHRQRQNPPGGSLPITQLHTSDLRTTDARLRLVFRESPTRRRGAGTPPFALG
jgi:hypothetical protein